jgi:hypothetical protein
MSRAGPAQRVQRGQPVDLCEHRLSDGADTCAQRGRRGENPVLRLLPGTSTWLNPKNTGQFHGAGTNWSPSAPVNLQPTKQTGWQIVRFVFMPGGRTSDFRMYDFYVDPRMKS